ncbi:hypothetical protein [Sporichthya sp.]|uniref:DUF4097 family beta strand repeat-containing protein n=1 Tax=Sporichthya sp. TaxID=65475 RepID=UPI0017FFF707|nr:hypothetical protein [Sporichthya sp.]MBA3744795.1 hypothetical protein [Sporichthya sp.]
MNPKIFTFPLTGPIKLAVQVGHGSLAVAARDGLAEATVTLTARGDLLERCTVELRGDTLHVRAPRQGGLLDLIAGWRKDRDTIDVVVEVPTGTAAKLASATADITVTGQIGAADVATGHASIDLGTVAGDLRLRYGNGESRVGTVSGSVQLKAGRVEARFGEVGGSLACGFGSGSLTAGAVRGDLHARSGAGSTSVDAAYGNVDLATGHGSLSIGVPDGLSVQLDITTGSGVLHSDLPVQDAPRAGARVVTLRAQTGSGHVRLHRAPAA